MITLISHLSVNVLCLCFAGHLYFKLRKSKIELDQKNRTIKVQTFFIESCYEDYLDAEELSLIREKQCLELSKELESYKAVQG